jgi:lysophospholipase L1-like esterase
MVSPAKLPQLENQMGLRCGWCFLSYGDAHNAPSLNIYKKGHFPGNVFQVDVWTTDQRPTVLCYGDSITQGFGATPKSGNRYPELLAAMLKCPTLNLGMNGDMAIYSGGAAGIIKKLDGVGSVIFLMGINDIIKNKSASAEDFMKRVRSFEKELQQKGINLYVGTILPAGGYPKHDDDPAKETLRQSLNQAIRAEMKGGNLIDFDAALCDPGNPARMKPEYQMDLARPATIPRARFAATEQKANSAMRLVKLELEISARVCGF